MKRAVRSILLSAGLAVSLSAQETPEPKALARHALATRTVAQEARSLLATWDQPDGQPEQWIDALTRVMLDRPAAYSKPDPGRDEARAWLEQQRGDQFMALMHEAATRASEQTPLPVALEQALKQADPRWDARRTEAAATFAKAMLPAVYDAARAQAVERQRAQWIAQQTYPAFDALDARITELDRARRGRMTPLDAAAFQKLDAWLRETTGDDIGPVFEELNAWIGELATAMRIELTQQYGQQIGVIEPLWREGAFPPDAYQRDQFEQALLARMNEQLRGNPEAKPPVYPVFTAVRQFAKDAAAHWEGKQLADFLAASGPSWQPDFERANVLLNESSSSDYRALSDQWIQRIRAEVSDAFARSRASWDPDQVRAHVHHMLGRDSAMRNALRDYVQDPIQQAVSSLERQMELIRALEQDWMDRLRADVAKNTSVDRVLREWTREWERRWETVSGELNAEWRKPFDRAGEQLNKTVRQLYAAVEVSPAATPETQAADAGEADPESDQPTSEEMTRIDRPTETPGEQQQEPIPQAENTGEGVDVEEGMSEALRAYRGVADGVFSFTDLPDGRCRLLFGAPDGTGARSIEFDPADVEIAAAQIADVLRGPLRDVLNGVASSSGGRRGFFSFTRSRPSELRLLFRVGSPSIRHQMSIMIRRHLDVEIKHWSEETGKPAPTLLWQEEAAR